VSLFSTGTNQAGHSTAIAIFVRPVQQAGRLGGYEPAVHRLTLTEVRRRILEQISIFNPEDLIPVPCHSDSLAMAYAMKLGDKVVPLTGMIEPQVLIDGGRNTIIYEKEPASRQHIFKPFSTNHSPQSQAATLRELLCCLPQVFTPRDLGYDKLFRILIVQFINAQSFDLPSIRTTCIHIAHPDGKRLTPLIPTTCSIGMGWRSAGWLRSGWTGVQERRPAIDPDRYSSLHYIGSAVLPIAPLRLVQSEARGALIPSSFWQVWSAGFES
jgi:hypothetical protein